MYPPGRVVKSDGLLSDCAAVSGCVHEAFKKTSKSMPTALRKEE
jgi:hypothetical protein